MSTIVGARTRNKVFAVLAAGLVVGVGATLTAASWTDQEWVFSGDGAGGPGIGSSTFGVQQTTAATQAAAVWSDHPTEDVANGLVFAPGALQLTPGASVFAPVALSTTPSTDVDGALTLQQAVSHAAAAPTDDATGPLWAALQLDVRSVTLAADAAFPVCDAANFATAYSTPVITGQVGLDGGVTPAAQAVGQARNDIVHYCFRVTLPAGAPTTLQGHTVAPAWQFAAESD